MSDTLHPLAPVLQWVLDGQDDDCPLSSAPLVDTEHLLKALRGLEPLGQTERSAILASPALRAHLRYLLEQQRAERIFSWRQVGIDNNLELVAAADIETEPVTLRNDDFELTLFPLDNAGSNWVIDLRLSQRVVEALSGSAIVLSDDSGEVWLRGIPDVDGELSAEWGFQGTPIERLRRKSLHLSPA